ncbi:MAG: alpha/beta family hydrolase [Thermodesulfobacteriota bacterium]
MNDKFLLEIEQSRHVSVKIDSYDKPGPLSGFIFLLAHGSSNDMNHPLLENIASVFAKSGGTAVRFNFLFREEGVYTKSVKKENALTAVKIYNYAEEKYSSYNKKIIVCGKSLGAKVFGTLIKDKVISPSGFISFGYPLHAKNGFKNVKSDVPLNIDLPALFFTGENDELCRYDLIKDLLRKKYKSGLIMIKNADHGLSYNKVYTDEILEKILRSVVNWLGNYLQSE